MGVSMISAIGINAINNLEITISRWILINHSSIQSVHQLLIGFL